MTHVIKRLTAAQLVDLPEWYRYCRHPHGRGALCDERTAFTTHQQYVTGRAGRVTWRVTYVCELHARRFAMLHLIELPAAE